MPLGADPHTELEVSALATLRGANYWSARPVTRLDLRVGAYEDISSADVPGLTERLMSALPGLREHRCSVGRPGGFELRLRRGTYAPHILEHVALELQSMVGHEVGYGRARGGDRAGEYTVVFEHRHAGVGRCSAMFALNIVRDVFGARPLDPAPVLAALERVAAEPDPAPRVEQHVACGIIGGDEVAAARTEIARLGAAAADVVELRPTTVLEEGLPYRSSRAAVILDLIPADGLPDRYRDPAAVRRLYSVVADAVQEGGWLVLPDGEEELRAAAERDGLRVGLFGGDRRRNDAPLHARIVEGGMIRMEAEGRRVMQRPLAGGGAPGAQLAATLAAWILDQP